MVPRRVGGNFVAGLACGIERHQHPTRGVHPVAAHAPAFHGAPAQRIQRAIAEFISTDCTHHPGVRTKTRRVTCEVGGRAAEMCGIGIHVPQHFTYPDNYGRRTHTSTPSCFWISSSGTPLVSGTIVLTQRSCSTIMPQKKRKTYPGANALTIAGKNVVSSAAKIQCVALPSDWPVARY